MPMGTPKIKKAIAKFPEEFGLRGFPGKKFRLNVRDSYESGGELMLVVDIMGKGGEWMSFSKGTPGELKSQVTALKESRQERIQNLLTEGKSDVAELLDEGLTLVKKAQHVQGVPQAAYGLLDKAYRKLFEAFLELEG